MNSGKEEREAAHKAASLLAANERCLSCNRQAPSEPCHYPRHRGSGGRFEDDWDPNVWVPLCRRCHDILDDRAGTNSKFAQEKNTIIMLIENNKRRGVWPPKK